MFRGSVFKHFRSIVVNSGNDTAEVRYYCYIQFLAIGKGYVENAISVGEILEEVRAFPDSSHGIAFGILDIFKDLSSIIADLPLALGPYLELRGHSGCRYRLPSDCDPFIIGSVVVADDPVSILIDGHQRCVADRALPEGVCLSIYSGDHIAVPFLCRLDTVYDP